METITTLSFLAITIIIFVFIAILILYIATLVRQLKKKQYLWFVLTLLFPIMLIVYWVVRLFGGVK